jgi:hypothetical protein
VFGTNRLEGFRDAAAAAAGEGRLVFHDRYDREEIVNLLAGEGIDVAVFLAAVHETYSYVLSEVVAAGVPVIVNRLGALPERVERGGFGAVVEGVADAAGLLHRYAANRDELAGPTARVRAARLFSTAEMAEAYRHVYVEQGILPDPVPLGPWEGERFTGLAERFHGEVPAATVDVKVSQDVPRYQRSRWYPLFRRIKFLVPRSIRELGRAALVGRERSVVASFDPREASQVSSLSGARLLRRGRGATYLVDESAQLVFAPQPFPAGSARVFRFWLRHGLDCDSYAQIFWRHGADDRFDARRSFRVELHRAPGEWKEYIVALDPLRFERIWDARKVIHQVRVDPISVPGEVEIGRIEFCA